MTSNNMTHYPYQFDKLNRCVVCHSPSLKLHLSGHKKSVPMSYSRCEDCTAIFQNPRPTQETMAYLFNDPVLFGGKENSKDPDDCMAYYDYAVYENALSRNSKSFLRKIARFVAPPVHLLEVGGATGWFMNAAREFGYRVQGIDISTMLATKVKEKYDIDVSVIPIEKAELPSDFFSIICSFGGIECWMDPKKGIGNVYRMLKKDGIFFFNYIDDSSLIPRIMGKKSYLYNPCTNNFFNKKTMRYLLESQGLRIISEKMPMTHISLGPLFHYFKIKPLFHLARRLKIDKSVFILPNLQARTVVAVKS